MTRSSGKELVRDWNDLPVCLSVPQAATVLGIGKNLAYQMVHDGRLPALRLGRRLVVPRDALQRLIETAVGGSGDGIPLPVVEGRTLTAEQKDGLAVGRGRDIGNGTSSSLP